MKKPGATFFSELRGVVAGDLRIEHVHRGMYSTDASIYQQIPVGVVVPKRREEVPAIVEIAAKHGVPILARGSGTSLAGQTTAEAALVIDFSKHLNKLIEVNVEEKWARVEPGIIRDHLNSQIVQHGLMFAPETATSNRASLSGMIGNNSSGMMSIRYGRTCEHILELESVLADGTTVHFGPGNVAPKSAREKEIRDKLVAICEKNRAKIEARWPKVLRRVGGYSLDEILKPTPDFAKFLCGSEGTLALNVEAKVNLVRKPKAIAVMAVHYRDFIESLKTVPLIVKHKPLAVELLDGQTVEMAKKNSATGHLCYWVDGKPGTVLTVEMDAPTFEEGKARLEEIAKELKDTGYVYSIVYGRHEEDRVAMSEVRRLGLGVMMKTQSDSKPISFIEDACVPVERLADYMAEMLTVCKREQVNVFTYGHASVGVLHFKPTLNLKDPGDRAKLDRISTAAVKLVKEYGGSWSGEHGDGIMRGAKNLEFWGEEFIQLFRDVKAIFDPDYVLNPGKIFDTPKITEKLRYHEDYKPTWNATYFKFRSDGGFHHAVEMCNGTGACRKIGVGVMCPSYMATRDEQHTTRGRANVLRLAMTGQLGPDAITSKEMHDVLDLCLECKACKSECPSNVDMAKMKSEFLQAYHDTHGATMRDRVFAFQPRMAPLMAGPAAYVVNPVTSITQGIVSRLLGIARKRKLPPFATETFVSWFRKRAEDEVVDSPAANKGSRGEVAIFPDSWTNYFEPQIGQWMVRALEHLGYTVHLVPTSCCGRTMISKGFLKEAKENAEVVLRRVDAFARRGIPVIVLEPSCLSALREDNADLVDDVELGQRVSAAVTPPEKFLLSLLEKEPGAIKFPTEGTQFLLHGHCHQKAFEGTTAVHAVLVRAGGKIREIPSGCCGMAGSFGYEEEHYELSQQIGEERLFPAVRAAGADTVLIASGFSCRHQIAEGTGRKPVHFAEAFARALLGEVSATAGAAK